MTISVIKFGWYSYAIDPIIAAELLQAAAQGLVREVTTKTINGEVRAVLGKPIEISMQALEEITDGEASGRF